MSATVTDTRKKKTVKKPSKKSSATVPVNGQALKKAIEVREAKKVYTYAEIWATRLEMDEDTNHVKRVFKAFPVQSEKDFGDKPAEKERLIESFKNKLIENGWFLSDSKFIITNLKGIEKSLDLLTHKSRYAKGIDQDGLVNASETLTNTLREINKHIELRHAVADLVKDGKLLVMPDVIPPSDEYYISSNLEFVKREPELSPAELEKTISERLGFKHISVDSEEVPEQVRELAKALGEHGTVSVATLPKNVNK